VWVEGRQKGEGAQLLIRQVMETPHILLLSSLSLLKLTNSSFRTSPLLSPTSGLILPIISKNSNLPSFRQTLQIHFPPKPQNSRWIRPHFFFVPWNIGEPLPTGIPLEEKGHIFIGYRGPFRLSWRSKACSLHQRLGLLQTHGITGRISFCLWTRFITTLVWLSRIFYISADYRTRSDFSGNAT
jgi:hypothetical protein